MLTATCCPSDLRQVQVSRVEPIEEQPQAGTEGAGEGGEPVVCVVPVVTAIPQELPGVTGAGGGEDGVVPVMAVPNYDPDHILTLTPDEIRLYWVWKTGKRILWLTLLSMCLTAFWILKYVACSHRSLPPEAPCD